LLFAKVMSNGNVETLSRVPMICRPEGATRIRSQPHSEQQSPAIPFKGRISVSVDVRVS
jgi:hypothetical protein